MAFRPLSNAEIDNLSQEELKEYVRLADEYSSTEKEISPDIKDEEFRSEEYDQPEESPADLIDQSKRSLLRGLKNVAKFGGAALDLPTHIVNAPLNAASILSGYDIPKFKPLNLEDKFGRAVEEISGQDLRPRTPAEERLDTIQDFLMHLGSGVGAAKGAVKLGTKYGPKVTKFLESSANLTVPEIGGATGAAIASHEASQQTDNPLANIGASVLGGMVGGYGTNKTISTLNALRHGGPRAAAIDFVGAKPDIQNLLSADRSEIPISLGDLGVNQRLQMVAQKGAPDIGEAKRSDALNKMHELLKISEKPYDKDISKIIETGADNKVKYTNKKVGSWIKNLENKIVENPEGNLIDMTNVLEKIGKELELHRFPSLIDKPTRQIIKEMKKQGATAKDVQAVLKKNWNVDSELGLTKGDISDLRKHPLGKYYLELRSLLEQTPERFSEFLKDKGLNKSKKIILPDTDNKLTLDQFRKFQRSVGSDKDVANKAIGTAKSGSGEKKNLYGEIKSAMTDHLTALEDKGLVKEGTKNSWDKWHDYYSDFAKKDKSKINKVRTMVDENMPKLVDYVVNGDNTKSYQLLDMLHPHISDQEKSELLSAVVRKIGGATDQYITPSKWASNYKKLSRDAQDVLTKYGGKGYQDKIDDLLRYVKNNSDLLAKDNHSGTAGSSSIINTTTDTLKKVATGKPIQAAQTLGSYIAGALGGRKYAKFANDPETIAQLTKLVKKSFNIENKQQANAFFNKLMKLDLTKDIDKLKLAQAQFKLDMLRTSDVKAYSSKLGNTLRSLLFSKEEKD